MVVLRSAQCFTYIVDLQSATRSNLAEQNSLRLCVKGVTLPRESLFVESLGERLNLVVLEVSNAPRNLTEKPY